VSLSLCTLNMEAIGSSETLVLVYQTLWHHILEDRNISSKILSILLLILVKPQVGENIVCHFRKIVM
jgi:hypothetical protein